MASAIISAKFFSCSFCTASMVVPPLEQTLSRRVAGDSVLSRTIFAEPRRVWAAILMAISCGIPFWAE